MCCPAHSDPAWNACEGIKGAQGWEKHCSETPPAPILPGSLSLYSKGPFPQLVIVPNLHKNTEMLCLCVLALCLTTQRHWPQNSLASPAQLERKSFLLHLWVIAQGTAQLAHHGSEQAVSVTKALGGHALRCYLTCCCSLCLFILLLSKEQAQPLSTVQTKRPASP